jgi:non-homologous end joining protein Ku
MARAIASGTIAFGLVSIPVRFYTATSSKAISFHLLHARCGTRIQYRNWCPTCERLVERKDLVKGYPIARNKLPPHGPRPEVGADRVSRARQSASAAWQFPCC